MRLTTKDLHLISQCPKRWIESGPEEEEPYNPARELVRNLFLAKTFYENARRPFDTIARIWDKIFWQEREETQKNQDLSVKGILAAKRLYKKVEKYTGMTSHSTQFLAAHLDSTNVLTSCGDFFLMHEDRMETWIYTNTPKEILARTPIVAAEHFLAQAKVRQFHQKPFYLALYYPTMGRMTASCKYIKGNLSVEENRRTALGLTNLAKVSYPLGGKHCEKCPIQEECKPWVASSTKGSET